MQPLHSPRSGFFKAWPEGRTMPLLVELSITDSDGVAWPPVVARPRVDTVRYQSVGSSGNEASEPPAADEPPAGGSRTTRGGGVRGLRPGVGVPPGVGR